MRALRFLGFMAAALGAGFGIGKLMGGHMQRGPLPVARPVLLGVLIVAIFCVLLGHEVGHLVGAVSAGFRVQLLTVGIFSLVRDGERLRLRWNWDVWRMGGLASALPVPGCDVRMGAMRMIEGGPLASVVLGVAAWAVFDWSAGCRSRSA